MTRPLTLRVRLHVAIGCCLASASFLKASSFVDCRFDAKSRSRHARKRPQHSHHLLLLLFLRRGLGLLHCGSTSCRRNTCQPSPCGPHVLSSGPRPSKEA
eukprot:6498985-Prorocentrum_lima.AAC.1